MFERCTDRTRKVMSLAHQEAQQFNHESLDGMKQVIVVNESLKLPRGKLAAQVAHASVASLLSADGQSQRAWFKIGMPKVVLAAACEEDLVSCHEKANDASLTAGSDTRCRQDGCGPRHHDVCRYWSGL